MAIPPGHDGLSRAMKDVLSVESDFVAKFLPLQGMTHLPPGFPAFATWHHGQLGEAVSWEDAAPAYALACLSHAAYGGSFDPSVEWELELQWADLAPLSDLEWPLARRLVMAAWAYLSGDEALPRDLDSAFDDQDEERSLPRLGLELVPAFVVLRESMAQQPPTQWRTRGQERWLPTDVPALSLAASPALAVLDALALYGFAEEEPRLLVRLAFAPHLLRTLDGSAGDTSPLALARQRRDASHWANQLESVLLQVPSPACPGEFNLLANPRHPDFVRVQRFDARPLQLDRRRHSH
ncbi:MAG TPA: RES domain-containing protein [Arenimonas sp.]